MKCYEEGPCYSNIRMFMNTNKDANDTFIQSVVHSYDKVLEEEVSHRRKYDLTINNYMILMTSVFVLDVFTFAIFFGKNVLKCSGSSLTFKAHLHYGKNCIKLVGFREQTKNILLWKNPNLAPIFAIV
jgi:hypothetical protein